MNTPPLADSQVNEWVKCELLDTAGEFDEDLWIQSSVKCWFQSYVVLATAHCDGPELEHVVRHSVRALYEDQKLLTCLFNLCTFVASKIQKALE